jgi:predicted nucleic acid-binding protein
VHEAHSAAVRRLIRTGRVATSRLSQVEVASALARREREGAFSAAERDRALDSLNTDLTAWIVVEVTSELAADAQALLVRHGLRSGDAVQLASCLYLHRETGRRLPFAAFDDRLRAAAGNEGLPVMNFR